MSKVGVLTFHRCINYGSYWQARCLVEGIRALGAKAVLLEHRSPRIDRAEWRCALRPTLPLHTRDDHPFYAGKIRKFFDAFASLPLSKPFALENPADVEEYETVIIGSDEVWNLKHPWYGGETLFFGEGLKSGKIASYAASFGNFGTSQFLAGPWREKLVRFDAISVRDYNSRQLVHEMLGCEPQVVLDPCLQFADAIGAADVDAPGQPFVVVYGHSFPQWFQRTIRHWASRRGWRLVSVGYRNDWADEQRIETGPEEFAGLMAASAAVATNFFHGCVFSLVNQRPFATCLSDYRSNKILDLARLVGADAHVVTDATPYSSYDLLLGRPLAPAIFETIEHIRQRSSRYLDNVLH